MTPNQRITLMADWWPRACRSQGWKASDRELRLAELSKAVGRELNSASDLNSTTDIDAVKAHLAALSDNLPAVLKHETPGEDRAVRLRHSIRDQLKCLALYVDGKTAAEKYLAELIKDKFKHGSRGVHTPALTIDDLSAEPIHFSRNGVLREIPSQLDQIVMTLARAIQAKRKAAGDTIHTMKLRAGLRCDCRQCNPPRRVAMSISSITNEEEKMDTEEQPF
jgi:hypothetical protein